MDTYCIGHQFKMRQYTTGLSILKVVESSFGANIVNSFVKFERIESHLKSKHTYKLVKEFSKTS